MRLADVVGLVIGHPDFGDALWFDVIWADVGRLWPHMEPIARSHEAQVVSR